MRWLLRSLLACLIIFVLFWGGVFVYFSFASKHKELLESNLSSLFNREVSIEEVRTAWKGLSPRFQISGFRVQGDFSDSPALAFDSLSAELSLASIFRFWPKFTEMSVSRPLLEIVSLPDNRLLIAGIELRPNQAMGINSHRLASWLLNHQNASWHDGKIIWRKPSGNVQEYRNISFVYSRDGQNRSLSATSLAEKGSLVIKAKSNGNVLEDSHWDASVEVLGDKGQPILKPDDLSLAVENGLGRLQLKSLRVERIRDFLQLAGLSGAASWLFDSQLDGLLSNLRFDFRGPFLKFTDWSLSASATDVNFLATENSPGMHSLAGQISADKNGGEFNFSTRESEFVWPKWYPSPLTIETAQGRFKWVMSGTGLSQVTLEDASFSDGNVTVSSVDAQLQIDEKNRRVGMLAELFELESVEDLSFESGEMINTKVFPDLQLNANAEFKVRDVSNTSRYFPRDPRIEKFIEWWDGAFITGHVDSATLSYNGELSSTALQTGKAELQGHAQVKQVELDFGFQADWPVVKKAHGELRLNNDQLYIVPSEAWLEDDQITQLSVLIKSLFSKDRTLILDGELPSTLDKAFDFLFFGPLIPPEVLSQSDEEPFPIEATQGEIVTELRVELLLSDLKNAKVKGTSTVSNGQLLILSDVSIDDIHGELTFTENSVTSNNIKAQFLGGPLTASLVTTEQAQPPVMKFVGQGLASAEELLPWVGPHLLSWVDGQAKWKGEVGVNGGTITIGAESELIGVSVSAPEPLEKSEDEPRTLSFSMRTGSNNVKREMALDYGDHLRVHLSGDLSKGNGFFDRSRIEIGDDVHTGNRLLPPGINFYLNYSQLNIDDWLGAVIDLALLPVPPLADGSESDTSFLDAMRRIELKSSNAVFLSRDYGELNVAAFSVNGHDWVGRVRGEHLNGTMLASPRSDSPSYRLNLSRFHFLESSKQLTPPEPVSTDLAPGSYPSVSFSANEFSVAGKALGKLKISGEPEGDRWMLKEFSLDNTGINTNGSGYWEKSSANGSMSFLNFETKIDEAGGVLDEMQFNDLISKGEGRLKANLKWRGAPHEFDFSRLDGDFDLQIMDGELLQVESGAGRLIGLLNFNSILRRLTFDFRDVFTSGLKFDKMQYSGIMAEGKAIMKEAFMLSPAVFVQMEGNIDFYNEEIDMDIHASPELAGNIALLSAIANPTAGAVVYITQRIFKDQLRTTNVRSYRAAGTWEDFELLELDDQGNPVLKSNEAQKDEEVETEVDENNKEGASG